MKFRNTLNRTELALSRYDEIHEIPPLKEVMQKPIILNDDFASTELTQAQNAHNHAVNSSDVRCLGTN